jgi:hypothetical protein
MSLVSAAAVAMARAAKRKRSKKKGDTKQSAANGDDNANANTNNHNSGEQQLQKVDPLMDGLAWESVPIHQNMFLRQVHIDDNRCHSVISNGMHVLSCHYRMFHWVVSFPLI